MLSITCHFFFICRYILIRPVICSIREICPLLMYLSIFLIFSFTTKIRPQVSTDPYQNTAFAWSGASLPTNPSSRRTFLLHQLCMDGTSKVGPLPYFYATRSNDQGHIALSCMFICPSVVNFNLHYNF